MSHLFMNIKTYVVELSLINYWDIVYTSTFHQAIVNKTREDNIMEHS